MFLGRLGTKGKIRAQRGAWKTGRANHNRLPYLLEQALINFFAPRKRRLFEGGTYSGKYGIIAEHDNSRFERH